MSNPAISFQSSPARSRNRSFVTYSSAYTLVPTYECFNRCSYCNFRAEPGSGWISLDEARQRLNALKEQEVCELLILSGEVHPNSDRRSAWIHHIYDLCQLSLELGFLPHTNAGPLSFEEMALLKSVNASMGLMLEQVSDRLMQTVHKLAPSKVPHLRIQQLEQAGELRIPFTTGLLVGVGETEAERVETLEVIARIHCQYGHIQEAIIQPYNQGTHQDWTQASANVRELVDTVEIARKILPDNVAVQIPPNLTDAVIPCIQAGASDCGGLGPVDEVNPDFPHPIPSQLAKQLDSAGYQLQLRLPVYPQYDNWVAPNVQPNLNHWRNLTSIQAAT